MQKLECPEFITLIRTYDIIGLQEIKTDEYDTIDVTGYKVFLKKQVVYPLKSIRWHCVTRKRTYGTFSKSV